MQTIYDIAKNHRYRIIRINENKRYLVLKIEDMQCKILVHFGLVPVKALLEIEREIKPSPVEPNDCKESGGSYGIIP